MAGSVIPMTSARGMGSLPDLVESREGARSVKRLFDRVGLPLAVAAEPDGMLPLRDLVALFENAAQITGDPLFGLNVGLQMADKFGVWSHYPRSAPDLRTGLRRGSRGIRYHQTGTRLELTVTGNLARYSYHMDLRRPSDGRQHLEHTIPALLDTFRSYAGTAWRPLYIEVDYPTDRRLAAVEEALAIPIHAGAPAMAVVFNAVELDLPLDPCRPHAPPITWFDLIGMVRRRPPQTTAGIVWEIVRTRLLDGRSDIDGVAERLGSGPRTLQRRLDAENRPYRRILAEVRLTRARSLLTDTALSIVEIALVLGYSDQAHFTRAFRREVGMTPSAYRHAYA